MVGSGWMDGGWMVDGGQWVDDGGWVVKEVCRTLQEEATVLFMDCHAPPSAERQHEEASCQQSQKTS